jgi:putative ABC transport system ATP-binding protein
MFLKIMQAIGAMPIIYQHVLAELIDPQEKPELAARLLEARKRIDELLIERELGKLLSPFDPDAYNPNATVGENLLFGLPIDQRLAVHRLPHESYVIRTLMETELLEPALDICNRFAATLISLFEGVSPNDPLFERYPFVDDEMLEALESVQPRLREADNHALDDDRALLLSLFSSSPPIATASAFSRPV